MKLYDNIFIDPSFVTVTSGRYA